MRIPSRRIKKKSSMPDGRRGTVKLNIHNGETISGRGSSTEHVCSKKGIEIVGG